MALSGGYAAPAFPGDAVEICGLESDNGRLLNGQKGVVSRKVPETGRLEVRLAGERRVTVKRENVCLLQENVSEVVGNLGLAAADRSAAERRHQQQAAQAFAIGDSVEICGLQSESGKELNGRKGKVTKFADGGDRLEVSCEVGNPLRPSSKIVNLKPANLRKIDTPQDRPSQKVVEFKSTGLAVDQNEIAAKSEDWPFTPGELVEINGLSSEAGQELNEQNGVVLRCIMEDDKVEVRLAAGAKRLQLKHLRRIDFDSGDRVMAEVWGLESENGQQMNGQRGYLRKKIEETGRYEIRITKDKILCLKPENLRLMSIDRC